MVPYALGGLWCGSHGLSGLSHASFPPRASVSGCEEISPPGRARNPG